MYLSNGLVIPVGLLLKQTCASKRPINLCVNISIIKRGVRAALPKFRMAFGPTAAK